MGYFDWVLNEESSGESSTINEVVNLATIKEVEDLPTMFDGLARIVEKRDIEMSLNVTFCKGKKSTKVNGNGKRKGCASYVVGKIDDLQTCFCLAFAIEKRM
ncbi:Hypothetical predicted protein [Olea europaea subsp. europaea]|uniref:Uncharacterized protein n=1 Tax=Olea europaea subsp. europaea TaxID=158383 RepID=A0A8S0U9B7_OLEEU|nr:Hypothetical predicted protein [Olea europaea subsp. europaea]